MHYTILASSDGFVETLPDEPGAQIVWGLVLAALVVVYVFITRSRRRSAEHYLAARKREQEMRDNDPDMRKPDN
jgi:hypothetical protein